MAITKINSLGVNLTSPVTFSAGTVSLPSITFSGDTNTGVFAPAADTIAFTEGGTESLRINSSGDVSTNGSLTLGSGNDAAQKNILFARNGSTGVIGEIYGQVPGFGAMGQIQFVATSVAGGSQTADLRFFTCVNASAFERMRITGAGETLTGGTTDNGAFNLQCNGTGVWGAGAYTNGSDQRIKENIESITSGLDVVQKLNPVTFTYKKDWSKDQNTQTGFIAQELLIALDGKNYINGIIQQGGTNEYYSVAYQNIIPILTKAVQELSAKVDIQQTKIDALEATSTSQQTKIDALEARLTALESK